ncbi:MAG: hypothetical protein H6601_04170 [Flavobacteriales bacterium]|nr:hypothetical protein [Flavobacteriales bacterium]
MFRNLLLLLFFSLNLSGLDAVGQVDSLTVEKVSIINAKHKVEGIYRTFDEFRRNEPFHTSEYTLIEAKPGDNVMVNRFRDELSFKDKAGNQKQLGSSKFFGYCRNDTVYISFWKFHPITEWGHLILIHVIENQPQYLNPSARPYSHEKIDTTKSRSKFRNNHPQGDVLTDRWYVLDYMTGDMYTIHTYTLLEKFEKWDLELFKQFKRAKRKFKTETQLEFIRRFNERNPIRF